MIDENTKFGEIIWVLERDPHALSIIGTHPYRFVSFAGQDAVCCYRCDSILNVTTAEFEDALVQDAKYYSFDEPMITLKEFLCLIPIWMCFSTQSAAETAQPSLQLQMLLLKEADKIIKTRKPLGKFMCRKWDTSFLGKVVAYIGIDNSTGDAWTEEFPTALECERWLLDENKEVC